MHTAGIRVSAAAKETLQEQATNNQRGKQRDLNLTEFTNKIKPTALHTAIK
jgi:hypothetical protein